MPDSSGKLPCASRSPGRSHGTGLVAIRSCVSVRTDMLMGTVLLSHVAARLMTVHRRERRSPQIGMSGVTADRHERQSPRIGSRKAADSHDRLLGASALLPNKPPCDHNVGTTGTMTACVPRWLRY